MNYAWAFGVTTILSAALTPAVERLATCLGAIDQPGGRKIHSQPIARLGGLAMATAFVLGVLAFGLPSRRLAGLVAGLVVLVAVGVIDDIHDLSPWTKLGWQIVAAVLALAGGIGIISLANPFGGVIMLTWGRFAFSIGSLTLHITPVANLLSLIWMVGLINAINFLDGLDGLSAGVSGIAALTMFLLAIGPKVQQPEVALVAIILVAAIAGFLPYNFYPARIFMGDSGSYFLGLTLALLAIYSGAKLAAATLVLGLAIVDGIWAVLRRLYRGKSPFAADRGHLHHLMIDAGLSQRQAVSVFYAIAIIFGGVALLAGSFAKLIALILLATLASILILLLVYAPVRRDKST